MLVCRNYREIMHISNRASDPQLDGLVHRKVGRPILPHFVAFAQASDQLLPNVIGVVAKHKRAVDVVAHSPVVHANFGAELLSRPTAVAKHKFHVAIYRGAAVDICLHGIVAAAHKQAVAYRLSVGDYVA